MRLFDGSRAQFVNERKTHIGDRRAPVEISLAFHLHDDVLQHLCFVYIEVELLQDLMVIFQEFCRCEPHGNARFFGMVFDQMYRSVERAVDSSAVVVFTAEILSQRTFLKFRDVNGVGDKLFDSLSFFRRDRNDGNAEQRFHFVHIDRTAVCRDFVHHVERDDKRDIELQKLHREIEVAFDICRIHDVYYRVRLFVEDKITRDELFGRVGRHRINAGQIGDQSLGIAFDGSRFSVDRNAGKVPNMLV